MSFSWEAGRQTRLRVENRDEDRNRDGDEEIKEKGGEVGDIGAGKKTRSGLRSGLALGRPTRPVKRIKRASVEDEDDRDGSVSSGMYARLPVSSSDNHAFCDLLPSIRHVHLVNDDGDFGLTLVSGGFPRPIGLLQRIRCRLRVVHLLLLCPYLRRHQRLSQKRDQEVCNACFSVQSLALRLVLVLALGFLGGRVCGSWWKS